MQKGSIVTNTITIIGIGVISALMFVEVPGMIDDIKIILSKTSVTGKAVEIANLLSLSTISPDDIKIIYKLPEDVSYTVSIKGGYVKVSAEIGEATSKTLSKLEFGPETAKTLSITKNDIQKVE